MGKPDLGGQFRQLAGHGSKHGKAETLRRLDIVYPRRDPPLPTVDQATPEITTLFSQALGCCLTLPLKQPFAQRRKLVAQPCDFPMDIAA